MTTTAGRLTDPAAIRSFITAGYATFTVVSTVTRARHTYQLKLAPPRKPGDEPAYFASHLIGPDNESDYAYLGLVLTRQGFLFLKAGGAHAKNGQLPSFRALAWVLAQLNAHTAQAPHKLAQVEVWHVGQCCRCGRALTTPESIANGIGPTCATRA